jgi:hypothetical protein
MAERRSGAWTGFIVFGGTMMLIIGVVNIFEGLVALLDDEHVVMTPNNLVIVDLTAWGWVLMISGVLMIAAGAGLLAGQSWARITAIVLVGLHLLTQIAWIGAYPVWSLLMIALDTVVLFALTARWADVRSRLDDLNETPWDDREATDAPLPRTAPTIT